MANKKAYKIYEEETKPKKGFLKGKGKCIGIGLGAAALAGLSALALKALGRDPEEVIEEVTSD